MIDASTARSVARRHLDSDAFELEDFGPGWQVSPSNESPVRGSGLLVVERDSGDLLLFPSAVPPRRLRRDFAGVRPMATRLSQDEIA
jgi:hypothetical protein